MAPALIFREHEFDQKLILPPNASNFIGALTSSISPESVK
jgi:hypothetical protein